MNTDTRPSFWKRLWFVVQWLEIRLRFVLILVLTAVVVGYWDTIQNHYERWLRHRQHGDGGGAAAAALQQVFEFFCPMHQFVVRNAPGKCPICGMDLSRRQKDAPVTLPAGVLARVQASPERILQSGIRVETVGLRLLTRTVRSYGVIEPDETRRARVTARFPGRIEELMVNAVGLKVEKGAPLTRIYSPRYLAAAQEYLQALNASRQTTADPQASAEDKQRAARIADYARQRLYLAGYSNEQLDRMASSGTADVDVVLTAPLGGTVLEKNVLTGQAVEEGTVLYTIADLGTLWVQVLVIESDLETVKIGLPVEITSVAYPGRIFYGNVDFLDPVLDTASRSLRVRVVVANPDGALRPGLAVNAVIRVPVGRWGAIGSKDEPKVEPEGQGAPTAAAPAGLAPYWCPMHPEVTSDKPGAKCDKCGGMELVKRDAAAKPTTDLATAAQPPTAVYTCPMHPEVKSDTPGDCPKCGMHLVKRETAPSGAGKTASDSAMSCWAEGYACSMHPEELSDKPGVCTTCGCGMQMERLRLEHVLAVPELAVIDTGRRKIVYVESEPGVFDAHQVTLGARSGAWYPVLDGLKPGDRVASHGAFLIDAEARLNPVAAGAAPAGQ